jgi:type IV pilus assembly protein PilV
MPTKHLTVVHRNANPAGNCRANRGIAGFTMLEILIAIVIVLLGVLGLAGLIVRSNQAELES